MPDGIMKLSGDPNQWLRIQARGSNYKIPCANPEMFPEVPTPPNDWLYVPSKALRMILKGVAFSASSTDDNRFAIGGVKIEISESDITMVATDGHRISVATGPLDSLMLNTMDTLLPAKGVGELIRLLTDYDGEVGIAKQANGLYFQVGKRILHSRLLTGKFPTYQPAFQQTYPFAAAFKADVLSISLKRTMQVSDDKLGGVTFNFSNGKLVLNAQTAEAGECEELLDSNFNGGTLSIALSAKFLLDYLDQMGSEPVRFDLKDSVTPIVLTSGKDKISYKYLLIPMRNKANE
jgi:DNA polymerase-3 subunit beta